MECKIASDKIIDFQFGQLSIDERSVVELHLANCPGCLQDFFLLKRDMEAGHRTPAVSSRELRQRIFEDFSRYSKTILNDEQRHWLKFHQRKFIFGGLVAAAATLALMLHSNRGQPTREPIDAAAQSESVRSLDETVDSGGRSPGHINIL